MQILPVQQDPMEDEVSFWKHRPLTGWIQVLSGNRVVVGIIIVFINTWCSAYIVQAYVRTSTGTNALNITINIKNWLAVLTP